MLSNNDTYTHLAVFYFLLRERVIVTPLGLLAQLILLHAYSWTCHNYLQCIQMSFCRVISDYEVTILGNTL